jgi:hypothetical protein
MTPGPARDEDFALKQEAVDLNAPVSGFAMAGATSRLIPRVGPTQGEVEPFDTAREAFRSLYPRLKALPDEELIEPRLRVGAILREAEDLSDLVSRASVLVRLQTVGVSPRVVSDLELAREALLYVDTCVRRAQGLGRGPSPLDRAARLREELLGACRWNLRGSEHAEALARITDSEEPDELVLDLTELAQLALEHLPAFAGDTTVDARGLANDARAGAAELAALPRTGGRVKAEWRQLRAQAFTYLARVVDELRTAGRYAYRGTPGARAWLAAPSAIPRRAPSLGGRVRSRG